MLSLWWIQLTYRCCMCCLSSIMYVHYNDAKILFFFEIANAFGKVFNSVAVDDGENREQCDGF